MSLTIGKLDRLVAIDKRADTRVDGSVVPGWAPFITEAWANITDLSATEFIAAGAGQSAVTTKIRIRWTSGIDATMRVRRLMDDEIFEILGPPLEDNEGGRRWLTLMCRRGLNDG